MYMRAPLHAVKFLGWLKKFRPTQNILVPVKGQGIKKTIHSNQAQGLERFQKLNSSTQWGENLKSILISS